ncbi:hypothetical protein [Hydrogenophaga sp. IBVHS2]|uniref:hypothetical protein n=1 Tax=Hydrogenophaga sp. IBVHS2 TaxID=1985170 RepID=UPI00117B06B4|nr:hypothetical protein [Hydrogenophaga sp. IBVHS2]
MATSHSPSKNPKSKPQAELVKEAGQPSPRSSAPLKRQPQWADADPPTPRSDAVSCTGLLDPTFLDRLALHVDRFPPMAAELTQLRTATHQMRTAEKALAAAATGSGRDNELAQVQAARLALRTQVRRMQMVLQGHQKEFGHYTPNLSKVTHHSSCRADWKRLQRVLNSIDNVQAEALNLDTPTPTPRDAMVASRWEKLCGQRERVTTALRKVGHHASTGNWQAASLGLRVARQDLADLLDVAQQLAQSGDALLLDPHEYLGLNAMLKETPVRQSDLTRFQRYIDQRLA